MKGSCSSVSNLLERYFDHEVTENEKALVEEHLPSCSTCQETLKLMGGIRDVMRTPVEEALQGEDFQRVWQHVDREIRLRESPPWWESFWLNLPNLLRMRIWVPAVAATIALVLVIVPLFLKKTSSYPGSSDIEYVQSQDYNVMVYQSDKATVIWLLDGKEEGAGTS